jgi:Plavaka transposase
MDPSFTNKDMLMNTVDKLPWGAKWTYRPIGLNGDILDDNWKPMTEHFELWYHDSVEVVHELMSNQIFKEVLRYTPEQVYCDSVGVERGHQ